MKYCGNCGKEIEEGTVFCPECGKKVELPKEEQIETLSQTTETPVKKSTGLSIAGMVLGILALLLGLVTLLGISGLEYDLVNQSTAYRFGYGIGYNLFTLIFAVPGLILSLVAKNKSKNGMNIAGIILNSLSLVAVLLVFVKMMTF